MALLLCLLLVFFRPQYKRMAVELGKANDTESSYSDDYHKEKELESNHSHDDYEINHKPEFVSSL